MMQDLRHLQRSPLTLTVLICWDVLQCGGVAGLKSLEIEGATLLEMSGHVNDKLNSLTARKSSSITSNLIKQGR